MAHTIIGPGSVDRRPDSFSWSYLTTFTFGPVALGDFSQGSLNRVWKVRCDGNNVYAQRQATADTYDPEFLVFSFAGVPAVEIDAAFDQQAHILVCAERPTGAAGEPEVWVYFFDPFAAAFTFSKAGRGRTPRCVLDDAKDTNNGDVLLFYMNDDGNNMCWRQQRDRYATEYVVKESTGGAPPDNTLGPIVSEDQTEAGVRVTVTGAWFPPYPHSSGTVPAGPPWPADPGTLGHFQHNTTGAYGYQIVLQFSEPIQQFDLTMYYPIAARNGGTGMYMDAVIDDTKFHDSPQGQIYDRAARVFFDDVQGSHKTLTYLDGFQFVIIRTQLYPMPMGVYAPVQGTFGQYGRAPTFGDATFKVIRDVLLSVPVPFTSQQRYIEDVYKAIDSRVHILYSEHNPITGRFEFGHIESVLYPQFLELEGWAASKIELPFGDLDQILLPIGPSDSPDPVGDPSRVGFLDMPAFTAALSMLASSDLHEVSIFRTLDGSENTFKGSLISLQSGSIVQPLILHTLFDMNTWQGSAIFLVSGTLVVVVIVHVLFDINTWQATAISLIATGSSLA